MIILKLLSKIASCVTCQHVFGLMQNHKLNDENLAECYVDPCLTSLEKKNDTGITFLGIVGSGVTQFVYAYEDTVR